MGQPSQVPNFSVNRCPRLSASAFVHNLLDPLQFPASKRHYLARPPARCIRFVAAPQP